MGWGKESPYHRPYGNVPFAEAGVPYFDVLVRRDAAGTLHPYKLSV